MVSRGVVGWSGAVAIMVMGTVPACNGEPLSPMRVFFEAAA